MSLYGVEVAGHHAAVERSVIAVSVSQNLESLFHPKLMKATRIFFFFLFCFFEAGFHVRLTSHLLIAKEGLEL